MVFGFGKAGANAQARRLHPIAVEIKTSHQFAIGLRQTVVAVGSQRAIGLQGVLGGVKADGMVGTGEHHPLDAMTPCRFIDMKHTADVGAQHLFKGLFNRHAPQVQDGIATRHQFVDGALVGQVTRHHFLLGLCCGHRRDIRQSHAVDVRLEQSAHLRAQSAGGAGDQQTLNAGCGSLCHGVLSGCPKLPGRFQ